MAVPSNRSPSPLSSRPNPHSRNSDSNSTIRRSFSADPFHRLSVLTNSRSLNQVTPANSPAGFGRRNSLGKEGMGHLQGCGEKENDRHQNLKPMKVRSPANGSKNFMSPTISAASKFTPSPRKKVLVERNDPVRTSISLSEGKATFFSEITEDFLTKSDSFVNQKDDEGSKESTVTNLEEKQAVERPSASKAVKRVTFSEVILDSANETQIKPESVASDCFSVDSNSNNKASCFSESTVIAPLDADPSVPPYDPKTNYLSPRPQFLHYKPNPRIEVLLNKEKGLDLVEARRLEDSFTFDISSENFSDTDGMEESNSDNSQKDSENFSDTDDIEEPRAKEEELRVYESLYISTPITHEISEKIVKGKGKDKRRFFTNSKCVSALLVFLIAACITISVTDSPVTNSSIVNMLKLSKLHESTGVAHYTKDNFYGLAGRFMQLSFDSISHLSLLINNLGTGDKLIPVKFVNLTDLQKDIFAGGYLEDHQWSGKLTGNVGEGDLEVEEDDESELIGDKTLTEVASDDNIAKESERQGDVECEEDDETEQLEEKPFTEIASDDYDGKQPEREHGLGTQELLSTSAPQAQANESQSSKMAWNQEGVASNVEKELQSEVNSENYVNPVSEDLEVKSEAKVAEIQTEVIETENFKGGMDFGSGAKVEYSSADIKPESNLNAIPLEMMELESLVGGGSEDKFSAFYILGLVSLLVVLLSAAAFVHFKRGKVSNQNVAVNTDKLLNKMIPASSLLDPIYQDRPSSQNWATEVDLMGESMASEMSSFQKGSSHSRLRGANEAQSQERKLRKYSNKRESLASSSEFSMGSPSYGSFTTYEKFPSKHHASGDDEIVTPVRRSSRIRNQVTSP